MSMERPSAPPRAEQQPLILELSNSSLLVILNHFRWSLLRPKESHRKTTQAGVLPSHPIWKRSTGITHDPSGSALQSPGQQMCCAGRGSEGPPTLSQGSGAHTAAPGPQPSSARPCWEAAVHPQGLADSRSSLGTAQLTLPLPCSAPRTAPRANPACSAPQSLTDLHKGNLWCIVKSMSYSQTAPKNLVQEKEIPDPALKAPTSFTITHFLGHVELLLLKSWI